MPSYEKIFSGTVSDQTKIFQKHLKIIEELKQKKKKTSRNNEWLNE